MFYFNIIVILFLPLISFAQIYTCEPIHFSEVNIKLKKAIPCARKKQDHIEFYDLKAPIKKSFQIYRAKFRKDTDRFKNNSSEDLQQTMLNTEEGKAFPVYFNELGIAYQAYLFDNGADYFKDGLARYVSGDKIGFINKKGQVVIPANYPFVTPFKNGYAKFCKICKVKDEGEHSYIDSDEWFFINKKANIVPFPAKTINLPFDKDFQNKHFSEAAFDNTPKSRAKLQQLCKQMPLACLNYATFLLEKHMSFDLGHFNYSIYEMGYSQMIEPDNKEWKEAEEEKNLLKTLGELCSKNSKNCLQLAIAEYALGETQKSLSQLSNICNKNEPIACHFSGLFWDHQLQFTQAEKAFSKACSLGIQEACDNKKLYTP